MLQDRKEYWEKYYTASKASKKLQPSQFAVLVSQELDDDTCVIDFGCGNGRDALYFSHLGHKTLGIDASSSAIANAQEKAHHLGVDASFLCSPLVEAEDESLQRQIQAFTQNISLVFYARFFLHAITDTEENSLLRLASHVCKEGDFIAFEFRTLRDFELSKAEKTHFRRFINPPMLLSRLLAYNFETYYFVEGFGYAKYKQEDAHVARCLARKIKI